MDITKPVESGTTPAAGGAKQQAAPLHSLISGGLDTGVRKAMQWTGSFDDYLRLVEADPTVARNAFQRIYDMVLHHGSSTYKDCRQEVIRYNFFSDPLDGGRDAVFGLDKALMRLVDVLRSAAHGYGTEKRILLLHGPVGSAKSTIVRLLKKGLERYSRLPEGALYTFGWKLGDADAVDGDIHWCPMHEEPLKLIPLEARLRVVAKINEGRSGDADYRPIRVDGDLDPFCRRTFNDLMAKYDQDFDRVMEHVAVRRLVVSEKDRVGIGTFQPKDEKNQDSTELTGDINYRKIAEYGSDSDPRAFNFDGELNIANRGICEFIEVLKLDVAFLYDLLGASQEHSIKPKKFSQTDIDEVICGHSVAGCTPILVRHRGVPAWFTLESLYARFADDPSDLKVLAYDFDAGRSAWTPVKSVFRHRFTGNLLTTSQKWGVVETTPNHSIYDRSGRVFYPEEPREVMAVRRFDVPLHTKRKRNTIDIVDGLQGFVREEARVTSQGGKMTKPCPLGWARLDLPRHATAVRAEYDPIHDAAALKDLLTVLVWYATEGHINGENGGLVISQANRKELKRVQAAYARITTSKGSIDFGAKTDSVWRLYLGSEAIARLAEHHCGRHAINKRLPDFLFRLPEVFLQHVFDELMKTDGTRRLHAAMRKVVSEDYARKFFDYKTISPLLAAQVGTLATLLGHDYNVYRAERGDHAPAYRVRFVSGTGKRGGRVHRCDTRLHTRPVKKEWLYDIECDGPHNFVCGVGNIVCHNTNEPEYKKLQGNEMMEAFRDRTIKIDVPYNVRLSHEMEIYEKDFSPTRVPHIHIAPHTIEVAAMWAVLTRLEESKKAGLLLMQKLKLYNGKQVPGFTEDSVREMREQHPREGMFGISPRYIQDKISNALVSAHAREQRGINPFMVMNELEGGLAGHSLLSDEDTKKRCRELLELVKEEYEDILKGEVQRAISADEDAVRRLCSNYIENIRSYTQHEKVRNKYTGKDEEPDERLMRSIEEKIDVPESRKDDFRQEIMNYIGALSLDGEKFEYKTNARLHKALELKLFEDQRDTIKLKNVVSGVVDDETQAKIDIVKQRLIDQFGYNEQSAADVLNYVASIFARGDSKDEEE
jgi:serine protein kinase